MMLCAAIFCALAWQAIGAQAPVPPQPPAPLAAVQAQVDADLAAVVHRYFTTQQQEDVDGYMSLWSRTARRPAVDQLRFVFDSGDDVFSGITITRAIVDGNRARVRVQAERERTPRAANPGVQAFVRRMPMQVALAFEKDGNEWKLVREGSAADELAFAMVDAATDEERAALLAEEPDLAGPQLLAAYARIGGQAAVGQDYRLAQAVFSQLADLARRTGYRKEEGEALQNLANAFYYQRRFPEALAAYEQRLAIERERGDAPGIGAALSGIATIRYSFAEYAEALARYREALVIQERLDDVAALAATTLSIGNITYLQGDFPAAITAYRRSLALNRSMTHAEGESLALEGLGRVFHAQGDYAAALDAFEVVLKDPRNSANPIRLASAAMHAGDVHFRLANLDAAKRRYEESRARYEGLEDMANVARVIQSIAMTELVSGRYLPAEGLYRQSRTICASASDAECAARATSGLAYTLFAQGNFWDAAGSYRKAVDEFTALSAVEDAARSNVGLSQALSSAGDLAGAIEAASAARRTALAIDSDDVMWRALTAEARAVRRLGDRDRALGIARAAVGVVEELWTSALDRPGASVPPDADAALTTFAVLQAESGDARGAFATSERLRAFDLRARIAANERDITRGMTPDEREEERSLTIHLSTLLARLSREKGLPKPDRERIASIEASVAEATAARRGALDRLYARLPELAAWRGLAPRLTADAALPLLVSDGTRLVSFLLDEQALLVLTLTRHAGENGEAVVRVEAHVAETERRVLADRIAALQQPGLLSNGAAWRKAAGELLDLIPSPAVAAMTSASRLLVVPHDVLWRVPFAAMPSGTGVLIDQAAVAVGGSLASLLGSAAVPAKEGASMVTVGAPELSAARLERLRQVAPSWTIRTSESVEGEVAGVSTRQSAAEPVILRRTQATEGAVRDRAASAAVLHVAAPFRINAASPLFSPILLASPASPPITPSSPASDAVPGAPDSRGLPPAGSVPISGPQPDVAIDTKDDGALELRELVNLDLRATLAVLSDGAATSMRDGASAADVVQWGWLAAGVPSIVVARWTAPGREAAADRLLAVLHQHVGDGMSPSEALRRAQLTVRAAPETSDPVHWAGWMILGTR
jgi:tetratricopeptide (TPR) repeat protein/CHAT domain-containing protein